MAAPAEDRLARIVKRLALVFALSVGIGLPAGYFGLQYSSHIEHVEVTAEIKAQGLTALVAANPDLWVYQLQRVEELLLRYPPRLVNERAIVRDAAGNPLVTAGVSPPAPVLVRSSPIYDSGRLVGQVEITYSYRDVLFGTLVAGLLGLLLSGLVYTTLLVLPLRALRRVTAALVLEQAALRDVRERLAAEEAQRQQMALIAQSAEKDRLLRLFYELPFVGLAVTSPSSKYWLQVNDYMCEMLGYPREELLKLAWTEITHSDDLAANLALFQRLAAGEFDAFQFDKRFLRKDGGIVPTTMDCRCVRRGDGSLETVVIMVQNITERKRAEEQLAAHNAELEAKVAERTEELAIALEAATESDRLKSEFMANVTHELRTPLNSVIGFAGLLADEVPGPLNAKQAAFAADILASGERLLALVEGILEMSRLDAAGDALEREPVEICAALEERVAAHRKAAEARGVTMRLEVAADAGGAELDAKALRRMLDALLDNAVKFNREGGTVAVSARRAGGALEIAVADTGIGIAQDDLATLFKPFTQLDAGLARRHGGVGLGLALARRLAELHGGTIEVASEPGKGSTFTLRLPVQEKS